MRVSIVATALDGAFADPKSKYMLAMFTEFIQGIQDIQRIHQKE